MLLSTIISIITICQVIKDNIVHAIIKKIYHRVITVPGGLSVATAVDVTEKSKNIGIVKNIVWFKRSHLRVGEYYKL